MANEPKYEIWIADLNSLYDNEPHPAIFAEDCFSYEEAVKARNEYRDANTAAWIQDKETGRTV